jgi:predicted dehydrogenase
MDKKIKVAVIGCGCRARVVVGHLLQDSQRNVEITTMFDPDPAQCDRRKADWQTPGAITCGSYQEAIDFPGIEWVMVFSPNAFHKEEVIAAFHAGKHVFSEKPLATSIEDCQEIYNEYKKAGVIFATGFVLRYSKLYEKTKEILDSGILGKLYAINADENLPPSWGGTSMCNWRRLTKFGGPYLLEKCCHDLDLINWFCGSLPSKVASFANSKFFLPENKYLEDKYGHGAFFCPGNAHVCASPFTSEKDVHDSNFLIAQYRNNILATFQLSLNNALEERRMVFSCTEGTMKLDLYKGTMCYRNLADDYIHEFNFGADGHGGGDDYIMKALYDTMCNGGEPKCSASEGLESAVFALACEQSVTTGEIIDLEPIWKNLER